MSCLSMFFMLVCFVRSETSNNYSIRLTFPSNAITNNWHYLTLFKLPSLSLSLAVKSSTTHKTFTNFFILAFYYGNFCVNSWWERQWYISIRLDDRFYSCITYKKVLWCTKLFAANNKSFSLCHAYDIR